MSFGAAWAFGFLTGFGIAFLCVLVLYTEVEAEEAEEPKSEPSVPQSETVRARFVPCAMTIARQTFLAGYRAAEPSAEPFVIHEATIKHGEVINTCVQANAHALAIAYARGVTEVCAALQKHTEIDPEMIRLAMEISLEGIGATNA